MVLKMSDIADIANVSKSAVSIAINNKPGISNETRNKILKIISEQGYVPLRKSRKEDGPSIGEVTFLVVTTNGLVQPNYKSLPFFDSLISELSTKISELNGSLRTVTIVATDLENQLNKLTAKESANGVIVLGTDLTKRQASLIKKKIRNVVFLDTYFEDILADFVTMDNFQGAYLAGKYIVERGYKKIGYFASEKLMSNFSERRRGFRCALKDSGLKVNNDDFYFISPIKQDPKGLDLEKWSQNRPDAVFCEDDYIAIRLVKAAQKIGLSIPDDLAIMGFDNIYEGTLLSPELSTIHVPVGQMASQALYQLQSLTNNHNWRPQKTLVSTALIKRSSL